MAKLRMIVEVPDADPAREDPEEVGGDAIAEAEIFRPMTVLEAEWIDDDA